VRFTLDHYISAPELNGLLEKVNSNSLLLTGFTAADCVAATAMEAVNLGYQCHVVEDCTVTFQIIGPGGKTFSSSEVHELTMASLHNSLSRIVNSSEISIL
jgi:nicotinamidase-related amidase